MSSNARAGFLFVGCTSGGGRLQTFHRDLELIVHARPYLRFVLCCILFVGIVCAAQVPAIDTLPQDTGLPGFQQQIRKLKTTARILHVTAHPDDEDGGMLAREARGQGATVELFTLTRGEGGQNRTGNSLLDELGVLRTMELLAADRYYGVEQRFSRVADFGFSKSPDETFEKWGGKNTALEDLVREIRRFRPDVIVSRFSGTSADGHGHHQAAGILTREAFTAAADPKRFPEQIKEGLLPWKATKLYVGARGSVSATLTIERGAQDPLLGMTYHQFAMQGLRHQLSQGAGQWSAPAGSSPTRYARIEPPPNGEEQEFTDGIDCSLVGLSARLSRNAGPWLRDALVQVQSNIDKAERESTSDPERATISLLDAYTKLGSLLERLRSEGLNNTDREWLMLQIGAKRNQLQTAAMLLAGLEVEASVVGSHSDKTAGIVTPGQSFRVDVAVKNRPEVQLRAFETSLVVPDGWSVRMIGNQQNASTLSFVVTVPNGAEFTRPYYHRENVERDAVYKIDNRKYLGLPLTPSPVRVRVRYRVGRSTGEYSTDVGAFLKRADNRVQFRPVAVAPALSVLVEPATRVVPTSQREPVEVRVRVRSNVENVRDAVLRLSAPAGWHVEPASHGVSFDERGEERVFRFFLIRTTAEPGFSQVKAAIQYNGNDYQQGFSIVSRDDLGTAYYYQPSTQKLSLVDVNVPENLVVGYVMGAGDDITAVLRSVGMNVKMIAPEDLATADLSKYGTIVLGVRAYDTSEQVRKQNSRLLEYVKNGGTLVVQYNAELGEFTDGNFLPYPAQLGSSRVSREDAPVSILDPKSDEFDYPNVITAKDFDGWIQERGAYFFDSWDPRYEPLLESHDPGESEHMGGLLRATYGRGTYVYCSYAFFRQLPAGVPGAVRFFVNLLSAPNEWKR